MRRPVLQLVHKTVEMRNSTMEDVPREPPGRQDHVRDIVFMFGRTVLEYCMQRCGFNPTKWALTSTSASDSCYSANQITYRHSQKRRVLYRLLSLIRLDRSARRIFPSTPPIWIDGPSRSRDNLHVEAHKVLHAHCANSCDERTLYGCRVASTAHGVGRPCNNQHTP